MRVKYKPPHKRTSPSWRATVLTGCTQNECQFGMFYEYVREYINNYQSEAEDGKFVSEAAGRVKVGMRSVRGCPLVSYITSTVRMYHKM